MPQTIVVALVFFDKKALLFFAFCIVLMRNAVNLDQQIIFLYIYVEIKGYKDQEFVKLNQKVNETTSIIIVQTQQDDHEQWTLTQKEERTKKEFNNLQLEERTEKKKKIDIQRPIINGINVYKCYSYTLTRRKHKICIQKQGISTKQVIIGNQKITRNTNRDNTSKMKNTIQKHGIQTELTRIKMKKKIHHTSHK